MTIQTALAFVGHLGKAPDKTSRMFTRYIVFVGTEQRACVQFDMSLTPRVLVRYSRSRPALKSFSNLLRICVKQTKYDT